MRRVAGRLELSGELVATLVRGGGGTGLATERGRGAGAPAAEVREPGARAPAVALDRREQTERAFLALCVALPEVGRGALARIDPERHFTSDLNRRAALLLRDHLDDPLAAVPEDDAELASLLSALAFRFDGDEPASAGTLELEGLQLEKLRLDREIAAARGGESARVPELAAERAAVVGQIDAVTERIDQEG